MLRNIKISLIRYITLTIRWWWARWDMGHYSELEAQLYFINKITTWFKYFPAKNVLYPCDWRYTGNAFTSWFFCHSKLLQLPLTELLTAPWLWTYLPVSMLDLLGQHNGALTYLIKQTYNILLEMSKDACCS